MERLLECDRQAGVDVTVCTTGDKNSATADTADHGEATAKKFWKSNTSPSGSKDFLSVGGSGPLAVICRNTLTLNTHELDPFRRTGAKSPEIPGSLPETGVNLPAPAA